MSDFDYGDDIEPEVVLDPEDPVVDLLDDEEAVILDDDEGVEFDENDTLDISLGDDEIDDPEATPRY